jgi:hypothetical protein
MAFQGTDQLAIERGGVLFRTLGSEILAYVRSQLGTSEYSVADIAARNALTGITTGDIVYVVDATGDATVNAGWAVYMWQGAAWGKISEQEGIDVVPGGTDLTYTASPTNGVVVSSTGTDATIPLGTGSNAGLLAPAQFTKLGNVSVTQPVDLDAMESASHAAVTTAGSANTNPIVVTGQALSFSISNLTAAP